MAMPMQDEVDERPQAAQEAPAPPASGPIVPASGVATRSLFLVVAIMAFLACITVGTVAMISATAADWRADISQEITIQIRPVAGADLDEATQRAAEIAGASEGVASVRVLSEAEIGALLEPWLGAAADLSELPVPRLVVVQIDRAGPPDLAALRAELEREVSGVDLDDHALWQSRLRIMANTLVVSGLAILVLVLVATVLSVVFATRGAMAANRDIVEVLHLVGAKEAFIARQFERHFLRLGFKGGIAGGVMALAAFAAIRWATGNFGATPAGDQFEALFGSLSFGWSAFAGIALTVALVAVLTAMTSRLAVYHFLKVFD